MSVLVEVAEARRLPAAESVVGDRHRDRHVDADHADLHPGGKVARSVAVAGEYRDAVAHLVVVGELDRIFVVRRAHHRKHGPEDLFLVDAHVGRHLVEQAAAHVVAVLVALHGEAAAVDHELGAFLDADIDITL